MATAGERDVPSPMQVSRAGGRLRTPMGYIHSGGHLISTESQQKERIHVLS